MSMEENEMTLKKWMESNVEEDSPFYLSMEVVKVHNAPKAFWEWPLSQYLSAKVLCSTVSNGRPIVIANRGDGLLTHAGEPYCAAMGGGRTYDLALSGNDPSCGLVFC